MITKNFPYTRTFFIWDGDLITISSSQETTTTMIVERGLDHILSHFQEPLWPRSVSTKTTGGRQVLVNSRGEAIARFKRANFLDCRISAYPPNADENPSAIARFQGIKTATPSNIIVMIDLDRCNFKTDKAFELALSRTLNNIKEKLGSEIMPTAMWSGRGYHIIVPLNSNGVILENIKEFEGVNNVSLKFLRYVESYLSSKKSDPQHNNTVSFNNCMLRIPGSINSKNGQTVKIIQKSNHLKSEINYLLAGFTRYIINEKYIELIKAHRRARRRKLSTFDNDSKNNKVNWIEHLIETPIQDHRKYCIWRVLTPYLLNIRKLTEQETTDIIKDWLNRCSQLRRLDFNYKQKIKDGIEGAAEGYLPISLAKLREENSGLCFLLHDRG